MSVAAILLAAGESSRMGQPKPLLPWFGATLIERQVEALLQAGVKDVYVVAGHDAERVLKPVSGPRVHPVINERWRDGKSTSVRAGVAVIKTEAEAIMLLAVDQPRPPSLIRRIIEEHGTAGALITAPRHEGHGGHPLVFDASLRAELAAISEEKQGVRELMGRDPHRIHHVEFDSPLVRLDLNTPEAYRAALASFADPRAV